MSYNVVEKARKMAKLPAFTRNGVDTTTRRVTQDQFADFVFSVESVARELADETSALKDAMAVLRDENHALALQLNQMERKQWTDAAKGKVMKAATSLELEKDQTRQLVDSVSAA